MSREILSLFIHCPCDKIHSWHAVNQAFSQDSVSGSLLKEYGVEGWGGPIPLGVWGIPPSRKSLQTFLVRFPQLSVDKLYVSIGL